MQERLASEQLRLTGEVTRRAHAERRSLSFLLIYAVTHVTVALWPIMPGGHHFLGRMTVHETVPMSVLVFLVVLVNGVLYRKLGSEHSLYRASEAVESFLQYGSMLVFIYASGLVASPMWVGPPFTAVFWGTSMPSQVRRYATVILCTHGVLAIAYFVNGNGAAALVVTAFAAVLCLLLVSVARSGRRAILAEAERNVEEQRLQDALLAYERHRIHSRLWESVGREVQGLVNELERQSGAGADRRAPMGLGLARVALHDLAELVQGPVSLEERSLAQLSALIDDKCRALCEEDAYEQACVASESSLSISGELVRSLVQLSQEMVRNAVVHGRARRVRLELSLDTELTLCVRDDGSGLSETSFANSAGGLRSAREWLSARHGALTLCQAPDGWSTELRVVVPLSREPQIAA